MKQWYEELFTDYAKIYDRECFTQGTLGAVDFIEQELGADRSKRILDVGCGTGRHAIDLVRRGYRVTGIDLSESQLERARQKAREAEVEVSFLRRNARDVRFEEPFDLMMMICEGAFPLMESDAMNFQVLANAGRALARRGNLILTTLNALYPLYHSVKDFLSQGETAGGTRTGELAFDLLSFRQRATVTVVDDHGKQRTLHTDERYYAPCEISWRLEQLGFSRVDIQGCRLGAFSRSDPLSPDDFEMLVIAVK